MSKFTVFCQHHDGRGTTWIACVEAEDAEAAKKAAREQCSEDWGCGRFNVRVLGIIEGDVKVLFWEDICL